jgi:hypothetical protein
MTKKYVDRWEAGCDSRPLLEEADREIERLTQREAKARAILEPMAMCDPQIREWLK